MVSLMRNASRFSTPTDARKTPTSSQARSILLFEKLHCSNLPPQLSIRGGFSVFLVTTNTMQWFASRHFFGISYILGCAKSTKSAEKAIVMTSPSARDCILFPQGTSIGFRYDQISFFVMFLFIHFVCISGYLQIPVLGSLSLKRSYLAYRQNQQIGSIASKLFRPLKQEQVV